MRRIGPNTYNQREESITLLEGNSDPSEVYDSIQILTWSDNITKSASLKNSKNIYNSKNYYSKNYNIKKCYNKNSEEFYTFKKPSSSGFDRLHITTNDQYTSLRVTSNTKDSSDSSPVHKYKYSSKISRLIPRLLKSLSFLVAINSVNSFSLALNNNIESNMSRSSPFPVSLMESSNSSSLIELNQRVTLGGPVSRVASFFQTTLKSGKNEVRKRSGGNRRSSKRGKKEQAEEKRTKWTDFMSKFDIAKVHGSGVYVDLGASASVGGYDYRMPTGKCPVVGKAIVLENGADFLKSITHHDPKERGLGFPATKVSSNSSEYDMQNQLLSPISAQVLRSWNYKHESDLSNCAEYSKNIVPGSNRNSKYRYPFVYDQKDKLCYILYSPMQYNQGVKYCDTDSPEEGTSSLACMYPDKDKEDSHLFYGSSSLHMDWNVVCPVYPFKDSIFGSYDEKEDECVPIEPIYVEDADDYSECSRILFEYSPSDVDVTSNNQTLSDVDRYKQALETGDVSTALSIMFAPRYSEDRPIYTKGVGINWATYSVKEKKCNILDEVPSCLIISNGNYALSSLSSPNEEDALPYPCNIVQAKGYLRPKKLKKKEVEETPKEPEKNETTKAEEKGKKGKDKGGENEKNEEVLEFIPFTSLDKDGFKCDRFVHVRTNDSCGTYVECSDSPLAMVSNSKVAYTIIILVSIAVLLVLGYFGYRFYHNRRVKKYHSRLYDDNDFDNMYDSESEDNHNREEYTNQLHEEDKIWSMNEPRQSEVTPVRISKQHN